MSVLSLPCANRPGLKAFGLSKHRLTQQKHLRILGPVRAETKQADSSARGDDVDDCAYNVGEYCSIDNEGQRVTKRSLGEMEEEFLQAMQAWYYEGQASMTDEEFETLKEELTWQGSEVALLSSAEQKFLEASLAYSRGKPMMTDKEYDDLKLELKQQDSFVTAEGPRCSLRSKRMYSDLRVDYLRMTLLNIPAVALVLGGLFFFDDITGFEVTKLIELPKPWGSLVLWGFILPACFVLSQQLTNLVLRDGLILKGPCPSCGEDVRSYFGDILTVAGSRDTANTVCASCKAKLELCSRTREAIVVPEKAT